MAGDWESFFVAQVGASAALTGLVFVALSINLARIMEYRHLVARAGEAVVLLVAPVAVGLAALAPYSPRPIGAVVVVVAVATWAFVTRLMLHGRASERDRPAVEFLTRATLTECALLPAIVGALVLLGGSTDGYPFLAVGAVLSIGIGILDAWVLLVEILR